MIKSQAGGPVHQDSQGHTTALVPTPTEDPCLIEHNHDPCPVLSTGLESFQSSPVLPMKPESEQGVQPSTHQACHQPAKGHCTRGFESPVRLEAESHIILPATAAGRVEASCTAPALYLYQRQVEWKRLGAFVLPQESTEWRSPVWVGGRVAICNLLLTYCHFCSGPWTALRRQAALPGHWPKASCGQTSRSQLWSDIQKLQASLFSPWPQEACRATQTNRPPQSTCRTA